MSFLHRRLFGEDARVSVRLRIRVRVKVRVHTPDTCGVVGCDLYDPNPTLTLTLP